MNYEFKHMAFLARMVQEGNNLSNEDCIFLTDMRSNLRRANEQLKEIDDTMSSCIVNV